MLDGTQMRRLLKERAPKGSTVNGIAKAMKVLLVPLRADTVRICRQTLVEQNSKRRVCLGAAKV